MNSGIRRFLSGQLPSLDFIGGFSPSLSGHRLELVVDEILLSGCSPAPASARAARTRARSTATVQMPRGHEV